MNMEIYQNRHNKIIELLLKLTKEKKIHWYLNQEKRYFAFVKEEVIFRLYENLIPPRWYSYYLKIIWPDFSYVIEDNEKRELGELFNYILNTSEVFLTRKKEVVAHLDSIIELFSSKEKKVKKEKNE